MRVIYVFETPINSRKWKPQEESIHVLVWYYFMPASIERESFRQAQVNGRHFADKQEP